MDRDFWLGKWARGETGFHRERVHPLLQAYGSRLFERGSEVFVPLCGRSRDMLWLLERGCTVVGVELAEAAVAAFFEDSGLPVQREPAGDLTVWHSDGVTIYQGDVFALTAAELAGVDCFYDRAALIALPGPMRERYAAHLLSILPASTRGGLLITLEYDRSEMDGPPFAVGAAEVARLFDARFTAELIEAVDARSLEPHLGSRLSALTESAWLLQPA